jgi:hypothetical protein
MNKSMIKYLLLVSTSLFVLTFGLLYIDLNLTFDVFMTTRSRNPICNLLENILSILLFPIWTIVNVFLKEDYVWLGQWLGLFIIVPSNILWGMAIFYGKKYFKSLISSLTSGSS